MQGFETRDSRRSENFLTEKTRGAVRLLLALIVPIALTLTAYAQEGTPPSAATSTFGDGELAEIVVTASKRSELLSKAPLAISALSQDQLTTAGVVGLQDLTSAVPSVEIKTVSLVSSIQVTIRGITNSDFNPGGSPAVATYLDGIYLARTQGLNGDLFDVDRVEISRGPQGTLYGRNSTGGNINVVSADPRNTFGASMDLSYGNFNDVQTGGMVNIPVTDELAIRGAYSIRRSDGDFNTEGTTSTNYGAADNYAGRLTALWTPSSDFTWRLALEDSITGGTPGLEFVTAPNGSPVDGLPVFERRVASSPEPAHDIRNFMVRSRLQWQLAGNVALTYLAGYDDLNYGTQWAAAGSPAGPDVTLNAGHRTGGSKSYSHELDLSFEASNIKNILGATYFHEQERDFDAYQLYTLGVLFRNGTSLGPTDTDEAWGVFDQATYSLLPRLRLTAGVRYSSEDKASALNGYGQSYCPISTPLNAALAQMYIPGCSFSAEAPARASWSNANWKGGVEFDLSDAILTYATVTTGFKAGGLNIGGNNITPQSYNPEKVTNYELGLKGHFFGNRVSIYADGFYMDYTDLQVTQLSGVAVITDNAAKAEIYGVEIEGQWLMTAKDHINGFFDYLHATYSDYGNAVDQQTGIVYPNLSGNTLPNAPQLSAKLSYGHQFDLRNGGAITPSGAVYYQSHSYLREFNLPIDRVRSYTKSNLDLEYIDPTNRWKIDAFVDNVEDRVIRNGGITATGLYLSDYDPPRTYGVRIGFKY